MNWRQSLRIVFSNLYVCLYLIRLVILSALVILITSSILGSNGWIRPEWPILPLFIMAHHIASVHALPIVPGFVDLFFVLAEGIATGYLAMQIKIKPYFPEVLIIHSVISWALVGSLGLLLVYRLAAIVKTRGSSLRQGVDVFDGMWPDADKHPNLARLLFGRAFQRVHFVGETGSIRILRAILGLLFALSLIFYATLQIIFNPIQETALTPVQESRARIFPQETAGKVNQLGFNIMIPVYFNDTAAQTLITNAISVRSLWSLNGTAQNIECEKGLLALPQSQQKAKSVTAVIYQCNPEAKGQTILPPAIFITVDFSLLRSVGGREPLFYDPRTDALTLIVGMSIPIVLDVEALLTQNPILSLVGGVNLVGAVTTDVREVFSTPGLAAVGLYQTSTVFLTPRFLSIYSDPFPPASLRSANISTVRLEVPPFAWAFSELRIIADRRNSSVLTGFASLGGLWTALSGIFAIIFGGSLLHFLYGFKDISILGVAHSFHYDEIRNNCLNKYPGLRRDIEDTSNDGLLALIRDHIINLNFLEFADTVTPATAVPVTSAAAAAPDLEKESIS